MSPRPFEEVERILPTLSPEDQQLVRQTYLEEYEKEASRAQEAFGVPASVFEPMRKRIMGLPPKPVESLAEALREFTPFIHGDPLRPERPSLSDMIRMFGLSVPGVRAVGRIGTSAVGPVQRMLRRLAPQSVQQAPLPPPTGPLFGLVPRRPGPILPEPGQLSGLRLVELQAPPGGRPIPAQLPVPISGPSFTPEQMDVARKTVLAQMYQAGKRKPTAQTRMVARILQGEPPLGKRIDPVRRLQLIELESEIQAGVRRMLSGEATRQTEADIAAKSGEATRRSIDWWLSQ